MLLVCIAEEEGHEPKNTGVFKTLKKVRKWISLEKNAALLAPEDLCQASDLQNCKIINFHYFKELSL